MPHELNLDHAAYSSLEYDDATGTVITITTAGTFYKATMQTAGLNSFNVTPAGSPTSNLTIGVGAEGVYEISVTLYGTHTGGVLYEWAIFKNGSVLTTPNINQETRTGATNIVPVSGHGLTYLAAGDVIDVRVTSNVNGSAVTINGLTTVLNRLRRL